MKRLTLILSCLFLSMSLAIGQNVTISGTVVDDLGTPIIGASIDVKGDSRYGDISDIDGRFSFEAPSSAKTLVISYVGKNTKEVNAGSNISVVLYGSDEELDPVIVVAYGQIKKSAFTGSAAVVDSEDIGKLQVTNVTDALKGRVSGVQMTSASGQPGQTSNGIRIRGISSINAGSSPLIILDGSPFDGDLNLINNQDIESMTVLKDAASTALYGSRGANGVIIITTKKGKTDGRANVTVDARWGVNTRAQQDYDLITNPGQYYEMYYGALRNYFVNEKGLVNPVTAHRQTARMMINDGSLGLGYNIYTMGDGGDLIGADGKLNPTATLGRIVNYNGQEYYLRSDDWLDASYKNSFRQEYNISATGGNQFSSFYASVNYLDNEGISANSNFERLASRMKADIQAKPWLKLGGNLSYNHYKSDYLGNDGSSNSSGNVFAIASQIAPIYPLFIRDGQGNILTDEKGWKRYDYGNNNAGLKRPFMEGFNALQGAMLDTNIYEGNSFNAIGTAEITFLNDFIFSSTNSAYVDESRGTSVRNKYYGQYAPANGSITKSHSRDFSYNYIQQLSYLKTIDKHSISAMIGHEYFRRYTYSLQGTKENMFSDIDELAGAITDGKNAYSSTSDYNHEGYFSRVQYDYDNKYYGMFSFRRDASSRFHKDHRWGNFWSASAAWNMSNETFMKDISWIKMLKLKASFGQQGNDNIGNFLYTDMYSITNYIGHAAAYLDTKGNKEITWETQENFNIGVDFQLFEGRLNGTMEYFYRKTTDMLYWYTTPFSMGYGGYWDNIGDMRNQGFELELDGTVFRNKYINWDLRLNLTTYKNKVTYLPEDKKTNATINGVLGYQNGNYFIGEGEAMYNYYFPKYAGVDENGQALYYKEGMQIIDPSTGLPMVDPVTGAPILGRGTTTAYDSADNYLCGTALPDLYGGFGTSFSYRDFDFGIDFAYQIGGKLIDGDYMSAMASPTSSARGTSFHKDLLKAWTPDNTSSNIPRFQFGEDSSTRLSDRFLTKASYLSLQNINLGYNFPRNICDKIGLAGIRVYAAADNVYLWSKRKGFDPRQGIAGTTTGSFYSPIRTISGGLTLTF